MNMTPGKKISLGFLGALSALGLTWAYNSQKNQPPNQVATQTNDSSNQSTELAKNEPGQLENKSAQKLDQNLAAKSSVDVQFQNTVWKNFFEIDADQITFDELSQRLTAAGISPDKKTEGNPASGTRTKLIVGRDSRGLEGMTLTFSDVENQQPRFVRSNATFQKSSQIPLAELDIVRQKLNQGWIRIDTNNSGSVVLQSKDGWTFWVKENTENNTFTSTLEPSLD